MQPEIDIAGLTLQTFGLCFALGFLAAGAVISRRMKELGWSPDHAYEMTVAALLGGLVGGKLGFVFETGEYDELFTGTGLVWYGGVIGGALGCLAWGRWRGHPTLVLADVAAVPLALGHGIGRVGCQLSGDGDYGKDWDGPWAMAYPNGTVPTDVPVHPTPVYEAVLLCLMAWGLWRGRDALRPGLLFACWLVLAGTERFAIEFLRRNDDVLASLTLPQVQSALMIVGGIAWLVVVRRRGGGLRRGDGAATATPATA